MTGRAKRWSWIVALAVGIILLLGIGALQLTRTAWFRAYVSSKIITALEDATGGRTEIGSLDFDWRHFEAVITNLVVHGTEPAGTPPYLRAQRIQVNLRLLTSLHHILDITYLGIDGPAANIIVNADGSTNVPKPKVPSNSTATPLETVVDLAIGRFELRNGQVSFASFQQPINIDGSNLRVQLLYSALRQSYQGDLSFEPIYAVSGRNTPVQLAVNLPVTLGRDRIDLHSATITTPRSRIALDGSLEHLKDPQISGSVNGHIAVADLEIAAGLAGKPGGIPPAMAQEFIELNGNATVSSQQIQVKSLNASLRDSRLQASGTLKGGAGALQFDGHLNVAELEPILATGLHPEGVVELSGLANLDPGNQYRVTGKIDARHISIESGTTALHNINLTSAARVDPHLIQLQGFRIAALGGDITGDAALQDFARFQVHGNLRGFNLQTVESSLAINRLPYQGTLSGSIGASGDLKVPGQQALRADANLSIAPGTGGIPVSGHINAIYSGGTQSASVANSFIALPHTRLTVNGSTRTHLDLNLASTNLNDLLAAVPSATGTVTLHGGQAGFSGTVSGAVVAPQIAGHLAMTQFAVQGRGFDELGLDVAASPRNVSIQNGIVRRATMRAQFSAAVGLRDWKLPPDQPLEASAFIRDGDLADLFSLADQPSANDSGALNATLHVNGTVANPAGSAELQAVKGTIEGQPYDRIQAHVQLTGELITVSNTSIESGNQRITLAADFRHPRDRITAGRLHVNVESTPVDLASIVALRQARSKTAGTLQLKADVTGSLGSAQELRSAAQHGARNDVPLGNSSGVAFAIENVTADVAMRGLRSEGQLYGDATASASTSGQTVKYQLASNFAGSNVNLSGNTRLTDGYPTSADATLRNLPVERVLALMHRSDLPVKGELSGTAHVTGTIQNPQGNVDLDLAKATIYQEAIDNVRAQAVYVDRSIELSRLEINAGPSRISLSGRFDHPAGSLTSGTAQFELADSRLDLAHSANLQNLRPGLAGIVQISGNGSAQIRNQEPRIQLQTLQASVKSTGIRSQGKPFGDFTLDAKTSSGKVNFNLDSNLAAATIHGQGSAGLTSGYPVDADLTFSNLSWSHLQPLISGSSGPAAFEGVVDGRVTARGALLDVDRLNATLDLTRLQLSSAPAGGKSPGVVLLQNQGPIAFALDRGMIAIKTAHLSGPQSDLQASGSVPLHGPGLNAALRGNVNLALLHSFDPTVDSSGAVALNASVTGSIADPRMTGQIELHDGMVNFAGVTNGISRANGVVAFNGNTATIRNLTAETGGGKLTASGSVALRDGVRFNLRTNASKVRISQPGVSITADGALTLTGTPESSLLSGTVTIAGLNYAPQSDLGSLLTRAAPPVQAADTPSPLLDNMRLDVQIKTVTGAAVQSSLAENLQMDADLRARGTVSQPGMLGRITLNEGKLVFFGSTYTVNSGTIAFYDPSRIAPVVDLNLETQAKGVDVTLTVIGPVDNLKLTYTSDPPLQFQEIISLLAAGSTPTSDPTLLANQPTQPSQNFEQMGESALLGKTLADPVSSRLERVFGVSQLKIDPSFTSGSDLPQAQLTLQQRIASNIMFTYITAVDDSNTQIIRVEYTMNPQWSATAMRDQNGIVSVNLLYRKQIR